MGDIDVVATNAAPPAVGPARAAAQGDRWPEGSLVAIEAIGLVR